MRVIAINHFRKNCLYTFVAAVCVMMGIYAAGSRLVIDEQIKYGNGFKVIIQEKLFPGIFFKLIPNAPGDGTHGRWEIRIISDQKTLGPFRTSWFQGIEIREDSIRIYDTDENEDIIVEINQNCLENTK